MQQLTILAANVDDLLAQGFTTIEVWQSPDYNYSFDEITADVAKAAVLTSNVANTTFDMGGRTLKFKVNGGAESTVSFDPLLRRWTPQQVAAAINLVVPGIATAPSRTVILTSPTTGRVSSIQVTYCDSPDLGFNAASSATGLDARIPLVSGTLFYQYSDLAGVSRNLYKWRFSASGANPVGEFSVATHGMPPPLPANSLSVAIAKFSDASGRPMKRRLLVASEPKLESINGVIVGNQSPLIVDADAYGFLAVPLVRGSTVRVAFEGSNLVRTITVPDSDTFDLLAAMAAAPDTFTIQTTPPLLIRRSI